MTSKLQGTNGKEVILSHVKVPPQKSLPKHYHPGEEFAFVVQGSFVLLQEGEEPIEYTAGQAGVVPFEKVHTIRTGNEGCELVVFRVHEPGAPERILVEE